MSKKVSIILAVLLVFSFTATAFADSCPYPVKEAIEARFVSLAKVSADVVMNGKTATCYGSAKTMSSNDTLLMIMTLQRKSGSSWTAVASWSKTDDRMVSLTKEKSGLSSGTYRVQVYVGVYNANGAFIESTTVYSQNYTI